MTDKCYDNQTDLSNSNRSNSRSLISNVSGVLSNASEDLQSDFINLTINANNFVSSALTLNDLEYLQSDFINSTINANNPLTYVLSLYGESKFNESLTSFNNFLFVQFNSGSVVNYPYIKTRLQTGISFTQIEYADFITTTFYNINEVSSDTRSNPDIILSQLNGYLNRNFTENTMGAFCNLAPNIFGAITSFFNDINSNLLSIDNIVQSIENINISTYVSSLGSNITSVITQAIESERANIENFNLDFLNNSDPNLPINARIMERFASIKNDTLAFFSEQNSGTLRERIQSLIAYSANIYDDLGIEEIQFLIYRFCSFAANVENSIRNINAPLRNFRDSYSYAVQQLSAVSNINTIRAVSSGAIRYTEEERIQQTQIATETATEAGNEEPLRTDELDGVTSWNNGAGDSRIGFQGRWVGILGEEGWTRVEQRVRVLIMRVQTEFGRKLMINSGYRSQAYNDNIRANGGGAARNSYHIQGMALDVTWNGFNSQTIEEFVSIARDQGFRGIGYYDSFIHVDIGPVRQWGR